jgi:hypothetical protein
LLEMSAGYPPLPSDPRGRQHPKANKMTCLEAWHMWHWPAAGQHL